MKLVLVQCQTDARRDSKGDTVGAGRREEDELRTGGRLGFFATGGRLVERGRPDEELVPLDVRVDVEREVAEREAPERDDGVPCERVPRCEPSDVLMVTQPPLLSYDQIHRVGIRYAR